MSGNEEQPISGSNPFDASKLPSPNDSPQSHEKTQKKGIKVEIQQPDLIYKALIENVDKSGFSGGIIGGIPYLKEDQLLETIMVGARGFHRGCTYEMWIDSYKLGTDVTLSQTREEQDNGGFISDEKALRLEQWFKVNGYEARLLKSKHGTTKYSPVHDLITAHRNVLEVRKNQQTYSIDLGYDSIESAEYEEKGYESSLPYATSLPKRKIVAGPLSLELLGEGGSFSENLIFRKFAGTNEFTATANAYTHAMEDFLNGLYFIEGLEAPSQTIILRPTISDQDTLSEIASAQTDTPITLVESQVKREMQSFDFIAGQEEAVREAKKMVLAINHPEIFDKRGVKRPKGILFYGPPGNGKTLLAKAIANEANAEFFEVTSADIGSKWYGESEKLMDDLFKRANRAVENGSKVVIFFDEIDTLAPSREGAHEATRRVVATLLRNMDGMKANPNVTIIAATNRPEDIDEAFKRAGRIDKLIKIGPPSAEGRTAILKLQMRKTQFMSKTPEELFAEDIDFAKIEQVTDHMSGADIVNLVNQAMEEKVIAELEGTPWTPVSTEDLIKTAGKVGQIQEEKRKMGFPMGKRNGT